jgi:Family of unknown function (DUF5677)
LGEQPNLGPYSKWQSVCAFSDLSTKSFGLFDKLVNENWSQLSRTVHHLFLRMAYQAKTTSIAIRLDNSWALFLPALALTRVRLEQTIVCSYLIHEEESKALRPFVAYIPIAHHKSMRIAMEDSSMAVHLGHIDLHSLESEAAKAQEEFTPGFSLENDKFERSWTKLDLRSMAKRRDALVIGSAYRLKHPLEPDYISVYKQASSIVHADCSSLSFAFLDLFSASPSEPPVLMAVPSWAVMVSAFTAHYDILQCYEILKWLGIKAEEDFKDLIDQWSSALTIHL